MESTRRPFSLKIFVAEGSPSGLKLLEKTNWTGQGIVCPRPRFSEVKSRDEFLKAGIYVLVGPSDTTGAPVAYIGEGDPIRSRLESHHLSKDFWTAAYCFTSKDSSLNKAHIQHLEHRLHEIAADAKRCTLDNSNRPAAPSLSEADKAEVEAFLDEMLLCFPVLGVTIFEKPELRRPMRQELELTKKGIFARGYESADGFIVLRGATAVADEVPSIPSFATDLRKDLLSRGILVSENTGFLALTQDYEFTSPSTAAAVLVAASINGRDWWKTKSGQTLKELQEADIKRSHSG